MSDIYEFTADSDTSEMRVDQFLAEKLEFSRSFVGKAIKKGGLKVNKKQINKPSHPLKENDEIRLMIPEEEPLALEPEEVDLTFYFEDEHFVVIEKPAGMITHPAPGRKTGTLVNALLAHFNQNLSSTGGAMRPGIVHRLDEDTSGLLVVAKTNQAHAKLGEIFQERKVKKTYLALLDGILEPKEGSIEAPMARGSDATRMKVSASKHSREALTHYKVREYIQDKYSLVEVNIVTGRTHQIRVHFRAIDHPVVGDPKYGFTKVNEEFQKKHDLKRQFLHAFKLEFTHPFTGEELSFESELPEDLQVILDEVNAG
jgi:23S rRNA pseudouridine1911/1915/1917 synthase